MTILVTGGTGNTGRPLVAALRERGASVRAASRRPGPAGAYFDWADRDSHRRVLDGATRLYLVPPPLNLDPMPLVRPFLDAAKAAGVRRVVLLGSLAELPGVPGAGELQKAVREFPEWVVLRPSGFMQNFLGGHPVAAGVRDRGEIRTATRGGRLGWIDASDIAAVAAQVLLAPEELRAEYILTGPEALGYEQAAAVIAEVAGRPVRHVQVPAAEVLRRNTDAGLPLPFATALAAVDEDIARGTEDRTTREVELLTGRRPRSFRDFVAAHRGEWAPHVRK